MTEDLNNRKNIYFPLHSGSNENLNNLLNKTSQIICEWFSNSHKSGPFPIDNELKTQMPGDDFNSINDMFSEINVLSPLFESKSLQLLYCWLFLDPNL